MEEGRKGRKVAAARLAPDGPRSRPQPAGGSRLLGCIRAERGSKRPGLCPQGPLRVGAPAAGSRRGGLVLFGLVSSCRAW